MMSATPLPSSESPSGAAPQRGGTRESFRSPHFLKQMPSRPYGSPRAAFHHSIKITFVSVSKQKGIWVEVPEPQERPGGQADLPAGSSLEIP